MDADHSTIHWDSTDWTAFKNLTMTDTKKGVCSNDGSSCTVGLNTDDCGSGNTCNPLYSYQSFYGDVGEETPSGNIIINGRPVGTTSYMSQSNLPYSGAFHRPVNHISYFAGSEDNLVRKYSGTQLTSHPIIWHPEDLTTASFYTVDVAQSRRIGIDNRGNAGAFD